MVEKRLADTLFRKASIWHTESEHRIFHLNRARTTLSFPPQALRGIILGAQADPRMTVRIVALCRRRLALGLPEVKLFRAAPMPDRYELEVRRARDLEVLVNRPKAAARQARKVV